MNKTSNELNNFSAKQSNLEDEITTLQMKMLMNKNQATNVRAGAEATYKRAQKIDNVSLSVSHERKKHSFYVWYCYWFRSIIVLARFPQNSFKFSLCHAMYNSLGYV